MKSAGNKVLRIFYVLFFITYAEYLGASGILPVKAYFKNSVAKIGQIVTCYLDFKIPEGFKLPVELEIKGIDDFDVTAKKVLSQGIEIDLFVDRVDELKLPSIIIVCYDKDGKQKELESNPVTLKVDSAITDVSSPDMLRPIKGVISTKYTLKTYLIIVLSISALIVIGFLCYFFYRRKKNKNHLASFDIVPPHTKALDDIDFLVAKGLPDASEIKAFYFKLSEILRQYVENIRGFHALEMTTDEIAGVIRENEDRELLSLLKRIDLIKFANCSVKRSKVEEHVVFSKEYINKTKPEIDSLQGC